MIRISGSRTREILTQIFSVTKIEIRKATYGHILGPKGKIDDVILVFYGAKRSFTTEDMAEIFCHGNPVIVREIIDLLTSLGVRPAEKGEFTERAFLGGRIDLTQAEAVDALIRAQSRSEYRIWLKQSSGFFREKIYSLRERMIDLLADIEAEIDFADAEEVFVRLEEKVDYAGEINEFVQKILRYGRLGDKIREGVQVVIAGEPNVGKSSIMNLLLNEERSIVTDIPGTTRDIVSGSIEIGAHIFFLMDTAGLRESLEPVEKIGIERTFSALERADVVLYVVDGSQVIDSSLNRMSANFHQKRHIILINKMDLVLEDQHSSIRDTFQTMFPGTTFIFFSATSGMGIPELERFLSETAELPEEDREEIVMVQERVKNLLLLIQEKVDEFINLSQNQSPQEIQAIPLREAIQYLGEISGRIGNEEILGSIFRRFCIGK